MEMILLLLFVCRNVFEKSYEFRKYSKADLSRELVLEFGKSYIFRDVSFKL